MRFFNLFTPAHTEIVNKKPADAALCGRSERSQNRTDATPCLSDVYNIGTRARRRLADVRLSGRSMVEMLGVLAIIGVLSVGAIAGYSKAMFKYKLNKHTESFNLLLNNAIQLAPDLNRAFSGNSFNSNLFIKLNLVPDGMTIKNNRIYDIFNNFIGITYYRHPSSGSKEYYIYLSTERVGNRATEHFRQICRNIVTIAKENSGNLSSIQMRSGQDENDSDNYTTFRLVGDRHCSSSPDRCLRSAGLSEIDDLCNACDSDVYCSFYIFIDLKN